MKRRGGTLYDVARTKLGKAGQGGSGQKSSPGPSPSSGGDEPTRTSGSVRIPPGILAVGGLFAVALAVLIWWAISPDPTPAPQPQPGPAAAATPPGEIVDPLTAGGGSHGGAQEGASGDGDERPAGPGPDPRSAGSWYFVLAETRPEGARRLAAFCRAQGLDAAVVSGHNARLERVVALPGLESASTTTDAYRTLDERIRDVGRRWKAQGNSTDLSDRYLARRKPQP
ncbi:MAG: hypothetical protein MK101_03845 [Phycisphaerales bacterium]|nr:hypothetical protein [Phycisphaerales bacterium]